MRPARPTVFLISAWCVFIGGLVAIAVLVPAGPFRRTSSDLFMCMIPLFANSCLLYNAASPYRRRNTFWMLLAMGCTLWLFGHLVFTYQRVTTPGEAPPPFLGDSLLFLHTVPFMAALALAPHARKMRETLRYGLLDLLLLSILLLYVYIFAAMPWKTTSPNIALFRSRDIGSYMVENLVVVIGFGFLFFRSTGTWRKIYGHLFGATSLYIVGFVWLGTTGLVAHDLVFEPEVSPPSARRNTQWPVRLAMLGVLAALGLA